MNLKEKTIGLLVAEQPLRAAVFDRLEIDYCCGGKQTLSDACSKLGIELSRVIEEIEENDGSVTKDTKESLLEATLSELVDHIQQTHHEFLKSELPRLKELTDKVALVHGAREPRL